MDRKISIALISDLDRDEVLSFLHNHFWLDEPMNESLGLGECAALEHFCWKDVNDNLSLKAIDGNGNCVGVFLCSLGVSAGPGEQLTISEVDDLIYRRHEKFYRIIRLTEALDRKVNLAERFPRLREFVEGKVIAVDGKLRGMGIAAQLVQRMFQEMRERQLPLMTIQCSGFYSAQVMIRLGFEQVAAIPYKDFLIDGHQAIKPKEPHVQITAFIKWVNGGEGERVAQL